MCHFVHKKNDPTDALALFFFSRTDALGELGSTTHHVAGGARSQSLSWASRPVPDWLFSVLFGVFFSL
jgi:hypothetical protein